MTEDVIGVEDGGDGDEAELGRGELGIGVCRDENWVGYVLAVIFGCPFEADAAEGAADIFL